MNSKVCALGRSFGERDQLPPQVLDLVAQLRGVLEPQLLGCDEHLLLERDRELLELLSRQPLDVSPRAAPAAAGDVRVLELEERG